MTVPTIYLPVQNDVVQNRSDGCLQAARPDRFARGQMRTPQESWEETGLLVDPAIDLTEVIASVSG